MMDMTGALDGLIDGSARKSGDATGLGTRVLSLRRARGWTLNQLSERTGISASALSKIERDKLSPTYANLVRLARGLKVSTSALFGAEAEAPSQPEGRWSVMRMDEGDIVETVGYVHNFLHMRVPERAITPLIVDHKARTLEEFGPLLQHPGEEFTLVLSGLVELHVAGREPVRLRPGDSVYFDSTQPHAYLAASRSPCRSLGIVSELDQGELSKVLASREAGRN